MIHELLIHSDERGSVREAFRSSWHPEMPPIRQLVRSESRPNTLRGMHVHGRQWDVWHFVEGQAIVRIGTEFHVMGPGQSCVIPPGTPHGFYTETGCILLYGLTEEFDGTDEYTVSAFAGLRDDDPWPKSPDGLHMSLRDFAAI